ncbi:MAG: VaFE repeat-containing surface-anchored protein [Lachnospiraceae bacterium]|nr:VaFE repeat-containing surface-anchored protein [Lachnospiraceae bacterium]
MKRFLSWLLAVTIAAAAVISTSVPGTVCAAESFDAGTAETAAEAGAESAEAGMSGGIPELPEGTSVGSSEFSANDVSPRTGEKDENETGDTAAEAAEREEPGTGTTQAPAAEAEPGETAVTGRIALRTDCAGGIVKVIVDIDEEASEGDPTYTLEREEDGKVWLTGRGCDPETVEMTDEGYVLDEEYSEGTMVTVAAEPLKGYQISLFSVSSDSGGDEETGFSEGKGDFAYTAAVAADDRIVFNIEFEKELRRETVVSPQITTASKKAGNAMLTATPEPDWTKGGGGIRNVSGLLRISHHGQYRYWYGDYGFLGGEEKWSTFCYGMYIGNKLVGWSYCLDPHLDGREMEGVVAGEVYQVSAPMFVKALYYGPSGPGSDVIKGITGTSDYGANNIVTHVAVSEIYARLGYSQSDAGEGFEDANSKLKELVYRYVNAIEDLPVPGGYYGYVTEKNGRSSYGYRHQNFGFGSFSLLPGVKVKKVSADPAISGGSGCYGLKDARFWIYTSEAAARARGDAGYVGGGTLITGADGVSGTVELSPGTYYMIEGAAPRGFERSDKVCQFTVSAGETTLVTAYDSPKCIPADLVIEKKCSGGEDFNSLEGTKFTVNYYDGYYDASSLPSDPSASWVIKVLKDEDGYTAALRDENLVSGTLFKKGEEAVLPLGTVTIEETEAAPGYINDGTFDGFKMYIGQIKVISGSGEVGLVDIQGKRDSSNSFEVQNTPAPPGIITEASDRATGSKNAFAEGEISILDTVSYSNLVIGRQYLVKGRLVDKESGEAVRDAEGNEVTAEKSFTADSIDGTVDIVFTFRADSSLAGKTAVVFETLQYEGRDLAVHADLEDLPQQIYFPRIRTEAVNPDTNNHIMHAGKEAEIRDTISYENLLPGTEYTLRGTLMVSPTGEPLTVNGGEVTAEKTFVPETPEGEEELIFTFDASEFAGSELVVFEELYLDTSLIAQHKDPEDEQQTVYLPNGHTMAVDPDTEEHTMMAGGKVIIRDRIFYENLVPGAEYAVRGRVMQKPAGEEKARELEAVMTDEKGSEVEELIFSPKERDGSVDVYFALNSDELRGKSAVIFETVEYINAEEGTRVLLFAHEDLEDEEQTIHFPDGGTTARDSDTGGHTANADENVRILDEVNYTNLIPGRTYTVTGTLMDKETGSPVMAGGDKVTVTKDFVPESANGSVTVVFEFDASLIAGRSVTAFEKVSSCGKDVFVHEDLEDQDQSIDFPRIGTSAADLADGDREIAAEGTVNIEDTVTYKNLTPGTKYRIAGVLMEKSSGKPAMSGGREITGETVFTASEKNGKVSVAFRFNSADLRDGQYVVFETLYETGAETGGEKIVGEHRDLEDKAQTLRRKTRTAAATGDENRTVLWTAVLVTASACAAGILFRKRKKN